MGKIVIKNYPKQNYKVIFNQQTGFFARIEEKGTHEPFWAESGPELLDISITNWCDKGCYQCYRDSYPNGNHINILDYENIIASASDSNVLQVALGGGNPNQHPDFIDILRITREKYDIVPSYTTNGRGLTNQIVKATKEYCGAVAISTTSLSEDFQYSSNLFLNQNIKTNIHFVLNKYSIKTAINWLNNKESTLSKYNAIIFLNYKPVGKYGSDRLLLKDSELLDEFFGLVEKKYPFNIGFDSCTVTGIIKKMKKFDYSSIEPCEAGRFSAFISEDLKMYPCSFMINTDKGEDLRIKSLKEIWRTSDLFMNTRKTLNSPRCKNCNHYNLCLGGCPFLNNINLC